MKKIQITPTCERPRQICQHQCDIWSECYIKTSEYSRRSQSVMKNRFEIVWYPDSFINLIGECHQKREIVHLLTQRSIHHVIFHIFLENRVFFALWLIIIAANFWHDGWLGARDRQNGIVFIISSGCFPYFQLTRIFWEICHRKETRNVSARRSAVSWWNLTIV